MTRILLQNLLLFLAPTLLYGIYFAYLRRRARLAGKPAPAWERGTTVWLGVSGAVLVVAALLVLGFQGGSSPDADYEPPKIVDGKVVDGKSKPRAPAK